MGKEKHTHIFFSDLKDAVWLSFAYEVIASIFSVEENVACKSIMEKVGLSNYQVTQQLSFSILFLTTEFEITSIEMNKGNRYIYQTWLCTTMFEKLIAGGP